LPIKRKILTDLSGELMRACCEAIAGKKDVPTFLNDRRRALVWLRSRAGLAEDFRHNASHENAGCQ
jgi:hypothetical protein